MPAGELLRWQEFYALEPWGAHYDDLRAGTIASAIYNVNRDRQKHPEPFAPLELIPWNSLAPKDEVILHDDPEKQSLAIMAIFGGQSK